MPVPLKTRILLADDHAVVRAGCGSCSTPSPTSRSSPRPATARRRSTPALADDIDLAVLDVSMPRMTGLQAAQELTRRRPELRVLMLSMHDNEQYFFEALKAGASGYVLKTAAEPRPRRGLPGDDARRAVPLPGGRRRRCPRLPRPRAAAARRRPRIRSPRASCEVVKLIAEGHTSEEIAEQLVISKKTVDRHRANILEKLGMRNRVELTRYAIRRGLVEP